MYTRNQERREAVGLPANNLWLSYEEMHMSNMYSDVMVVMQAATVVVQTAWRGLQARRWYYAQLDLRWRFTQQQSAIVIQSVIRRKVAYMHYLKLVQEQHCMASIAIQSCVRAKLARVHALHLKQDYNQAAIVVQSQQRRHAARKGRQQLQSAKEQQACIVICRHMQGHQVRSVCRREIERKHRLKHERTQALAVIEKRIQLAAEQAAKVELQVKWQEEAVQALQIKKNKWAVTKSKLRLSHLL